MSTLTKEWLHQTIADLEEERDATPGAVNEDAANALAAMKIALASLEADGALANEGTITATQFKPVADLYEVTVPGGRSTTFTKDAAEASDCRVMGWSVQEYVKLERYQAAMLQGADGKPELTVWYGAMPESNGKANWTAILHRKGEGRCMNGFTIDRSEYPGRVLYAADRVRYLIGEKSERPSILDYDADAHSGYMKTGNSPVIPDGWVMVPEEPTHEMLEAGDEQFGTYDVYRRMIAASPQQK
ncbi:hypothetical protein ERU29_15410 [Escherichia coli]|uniref:hypothetical protein n=1 Tax=Escherichia coli TaxID=562 RepID=UPI000CF0D78A|nr:hypothetical protein [Escherichia coli]EEY5789851.1 hypothetical protein [Escherichia coli]EFM4637642.1 hypothetical protein [Escherichia coli]EFN4648812.1 hypothetical protein [Escherichia coli]EKJ9976815.1 hypothetical protein [Escherichia coli]MBL7377007.1 hypothetical protein [Escherichia coli]